MPALHNTFPTMMGSIMTFFTIIIIMAANPLGTCRGLEV